MNDKPSDLIFDVGAHRGEDSDFYLKPMPFKFGELPQVGVPGM